MNSALFPIAVKADKDSNDSPLAIDASANDNSNTAANQLSLDWLRNQSYDEKKIKDDKSSESERDVDKSGVVAEKQAKRKEKSKSRSEHEKKFKVESEQSTNILKYSSKHVFLEDTGLKPESAFRIDRKPDQNNLAFTSLYYLYVPSYDKQRTVKSTKLKDKTKEKKNKYIRYHKAEITDDAIVEEAFETSSVCSKLPTFITTNITKPAIGDRISSIYDHATMQYIQGKGIAKTDQTKNDINFVSLRDSIQTTQKPQLLSQKQLIYNKTQEMNKYLSSNPHDIDKWIEFINFQDEAIESQELDYGKTMKVRILEKKLAVVDKALESNPKDTTLNIKRLEILKNLWEPEKISDEWKNLAFVYPNIPSIWQGYIRFLQTHISYFTVSSVIKVFIKCISTYSKMLEGFFQSHQPPNNLEEELLIITFMFCEHLEQCGFSERALATWQALIEFNLYTPQSLDLNKPLSEWLEFFELFWDSGVPRFGENGSKGWSKLNAQSISQLSNNVNIDDLEDSIICKTLSRTETWILLEELRESHYWLPPKAADAEEVDDVDRNVFFDDIEPILFRLRTPDAKYRLVLYFLKFLRATDNLDPLPSIYISHPSYFIPEMDKCLNVRKCVEKEKMFEFTLNCLEETMKIFEKTAQTKLFYLKYLLRNVNLKISVYDLREKFQHLSENLSAEDIEIWKLYTDFELEYGSVEDSCKICEKAISSFSNANNKRALLQILENYVKMMLGLSKVESFSQKVGNANFDTKTILKTLIEALISRKLDEITSLSVLKAKRCLENLRKSEDSDIKLSCLILEAFFNYLNNNFEEAIEIYENFLSFSKESKTEELLFHNYILLRILLMKTNTANLMSLRRIVERALSRYPTNSFFLNIFVDIELRSSINGRIGRYFSKLLNQSQYKTVNVWLFAIYSELKRLKNINENIKDETNTASNGIVTKIRSLMERSVSCENSENNLCLWRLYLKFELLYTDGIRYSIADLQDILDVMTEKEIKIRTPVDEMDLLLDNYKENNKKKQQQDADENVCSPKMQ
ncbi:protein NRDE2-like protein [Dinothrombium tinctorium]|uniref:Protein NRDE2-like protein n=1 Tax=Dinothrombium tinctorium TaxID=1965070 RepID=A0A3S3S3M2_9ACAR|nr:protein NRDE2-like protein [Dinothrombium tinctorium]